MALFPYQRLDGFFTQQKFIAGQTLTELERRLGYRTGRLSQGAYVYRAEVLPANSDFELYGYSQIPGDRSNSADGQYSRSKADEIWGTANYDLNKLKNMARNGWRLTGPDSLVKVIPVIRHSSKEEYPPGSGVPQWRITNAIRCRQMGFVKGPSDRVKVF